MKSLVVVPFSIVIVMTIVFLLRALSTNFTPRMFFYNVQPESIVKSEKKVEFVVHSDENYLGIISVDSASGIVKDTGGKYVFRLYEVDTGNIIAENSYRASDLSYVKTFSFGIPVQDDSINKDYKVELELVCNDVCSKITVPESITLRHYFPKSLFLTDPLLVSEYFSQKLSSTITHTSLFTIVEIIFLPTVGYYVFYILYKNIAIINKLKRNIYRQISGQKLDLKLLLLLSLDTVVQNGWLLLVIFTLVLGQILINKSIVNPKLLTTLFVACYLLMIANMSYLSIRLSFWIFIILMLFTHQRLTQKMQSTKY